MKQHNPLPLFPLGLPLLHKQSLSTYISLMFLYPASSHITPPTATCPSTLSHSLHCLDSSPHPCYPSPFTPLLLPPPLLSPSLQSSHSLLLVSHKTPVNVGRHWHVSGATQVPPFSQGLVQTAVIQSRGRESNINRTNHKWPMCTHTICGKIVDRLRCILYHGMASYVPGMCLQ